MIARYTTKELNNCWSINRRFGLFVRVEALYLQALETEGLVPQGTGKILMDLEIDPGEVTRLEQETGHEIVAFIKVCEARIGQAARFIHFGLTSSDIMDTVFSLQLKEAAAEVQKELDRVIAMLEGLARQYRDTPMIGRTHGIHAEPVTFGYVMLGYFNEFRRQAARLKQATRECAVGKLAGAVGTHVHSSPQWEKEVLERLGLSPEPAATQVVARDRYAYFFGVLAGLGGSIERLAVNLRHMQRTEVSEVFEPFGSNQAGSSAMPHKRNPVLLENITGLVRLLRSYSVAAFENQALWHERDISHSSVERVIGPDATTLAHFALRRLGRVLEGLDVDPVRMRRNLDASQGLWASECVLLSLVKAGLMRGEAYTIVQTAAKRAIAEKRGFMEVLKQDEQTVKLLTNPGIEKCFDLRVVFKNMDELYKRSGLDPTGGNHAGQRTLQG